MPDSFSPPPNPPQPLARPIALVGMPGSGKSSVGRQLARQLQCAFADSDAEIERRVGTSVSSIFEHQGEPAFRRIESDVLAELAARGNQVLATGGGAVLAPENRAVLREHCWVVYLRTTPEDLARRLRHDTRRPLLQGVDPLRKLRELHRVRDPLYRELADFSVDSGRASAAMTVNLIVMQLDMARSRPD